MVRLVYSSKMTTNNKMSNTVVQNNDQVHSMKDHTHLRLTTERTFKTRHSSLELFFLLSSGVYMFILATPLVLHPLDGRYAAKPHLLKQYKQTRLRQKQLRKLRKRFHAEKLTSDLSTHRVVFLEDASNYGTFNAPKLEQLQPQQDVENYGTDMQQDGSNDCVPMAKWQTMSFPTCNIFHETNIFSSSRVLSYLNLGRHDGSNIHFERQNTSMNVTNQMEHILWDFSTAQRLGNGWFRDVWKVENFDQSFKMAVKTLRLDREFLPEYYELHRRDAVAMERVTASPFVMDIYGYCGNSAMTELAFGEKGIDNLYRLAAGLKDNFSPYILQTKLQIAAMVAMGLSHVHNVPLDVDEGGDKNKIHKRATIAHYDFNPRNIIISADGTPKINDFNCAEFLSWNVESQQTCGFEARFHEPWWRAPEEMTIYNTTSEGDKFLNSRTVNEKVDVYSLGNTLFVLLTGLEPRGKEHKQLRYHNVSIDVANGVMPMLPKVYNESMDPAITAIRNAITKCWEPDPDQ